MSKKIIVVATISQDGVYAIGNTIPWLIKEEQTHFKKQTIWQTVVMGRITWESFPKGKKPLPSRENIIVTKNEAYVAGSLRVCSTLDQAIQEAKTDKVFGIGGRGIWYPMMEIADEAYISVIKKNFHDPSLDVHLAEELLHPSNKWGFRLASSINNSAGEIPFTINHWVRV